MFRRATQHMDSFIRVVEWTAAFFIGLVALTIFVSVLLRYAFGITIPDAYDFGQLMLGVVIFWGIAATSYRGAHITVDLLWTSANTYWKRAIDLFATLILLFVVTAQTYTLFDKFSTTWSANVSTFDLRIPIWPFYAVAWVGDVAAVLLIAVRSYRIIAYPESVETIDETLATSE